MEIITFDNFDLVANSEDKYHATLELYLNF